MIELIYAFDEAKSAKRLALIKLLLKHIVIRQKEEEKFMQYVMKNEHLYEINIVDKLENVLFEIGDFLGLEEEETEGAFQSIQNNDKNVDKVVEEFCEKYQL